MYKVKLSEKFRRKYKQLIKNNLKLQEKINSTFEKLKEDPFQKSLRTHKVHFSQLGEVFSSRVTGDLRVLWLMQSDICILLLLDIGGHSGKTGVYK